MGSHFSAGALFCIENHFSMLKRFLFYTKCSYQYRLFVVNSQFIQDWRQTHWTCFTLQCWNCSCHHHVPAGPSSKLSRWHARLLCSCHLILMKQNWFWTLTSIVDDRFVMFHIASKWLDCESAYCWLLKEPESV